MKTSNWHIWIWIIAVAASVGAALFLASRTPQCTYTPTGDEMFDRFALLLLDESKEKWNSQPAYGTS